MPLFMGARLPLRSPVLPTMCNSMSQISSGQSFPLVYSDLEFTVGDNVCGNGETPLEFENGTTLYLAFKEPGLTRLITLIPGLINFPLQPKTEVTELY